MCVYISYCTIALEFRRERGEMTLHHSSLSLTFSEMYSGLPTSQIIYNDITCYSECRGCTSPVSSVGRASDF